jgi:hypothetical protein
MTDIAHEAGANDHLCAGYSIRRQVRQNGADGALARTICDTARSTATEALVKRVALGSRISTGDIVYATPTCAREWTRGAALRVRSKVWAA